MQQQEFDSMQIAEHSGVYTTPESGQKLTTIINSAWGNNFKLNLYCRCSSRLKLYGLGSMYDDKKL